MSDEIRPAATIIPLRMESDGGFSIYMVQRHKGMGFMPNMWVFPGGRVDDADYTVADKHVVGGSVVMGAMQCDDAVARAYLIAAFRETFEEVGIWLGSQGLSQAKRDDLNAGGSLADALSGTDVVLDLDRIHYLANWVTPKGESRRSGNRRYDTRFFVADVGDVVGVIDDREVVDHAWVTAAEALGRGLNAFPMAPPTWWVLTELAKYASVAEVLAMTDVPVRPVRPLLRVDEAGFRILLPGHEEHEEPVIDGMPKVIRLAPPVWSMEY